MNIKTLIDTVTSDLGDNESGYENTTWTRKQIREWIIEGYNTTFDNRPDLFMELKTFQVTPCSIIQDVCDCATIRRVIGQANEKGRLIKPLRERGLEISFQWSGKSCVKQSGGGFRLESYAIDKVSERLYLFPEVPPHEKVFVTVECSVRPSDLKDTDNIKADCATAVIQWALWRARSMDAEVSTIAADAAQTHYKAFFDLLGVSLNKQTVIHKRASE